MSKEIDERVVSLEFDNQNFESNVATSISTLDKLNTKLNLPAATKGLENVSKAASNVNLADLTSSVQALESRFSTMGIVGATAISNITTKMMQLSGRTINFLTNGIVQGGISRALKIETAKFQLNALLKDTDAVAAVMKNVSAAVDGTAYSLDAAASVASQLAASGMTAGEQMESTLKGISGVAAMTSSSYEDIGRIFTQVAGQGKLMGDQLLQLSSRGMNAAADIAKYLTKIGDGAEVTEAQVRSMVSKGTIDFDTFAKAMNDTYADAAFKANETVTGNISNIKAALAKIGATFVQPLVESNGPLVQLLQAIREKIVAIKDKLVPPLEAASEKVGNVLKKLAGIIKGDSFSVSNEAWDKLSQKIQDAGINVEDFQNKFKEVAKQQGIDVDSLIEKTGSFGTALMEMKNPGKIAIQTLKDISKEYEQNGIDQEKLQEKLTYLQEMVDQTWYGTWNNQPIRQQLMEQYGHNYQEIQELVNKTVDQHRLTVEDLNEETLKSLGYTEDQINLLQDLADEAEKSGTSVNDLITALNKPSKSFLLFDTFANVVAGAKKIISSFKEALSDAFTPLDGDPIWEVIDLLHDLSEHFVISDENAQKLTRTFKGLFAAIDLVALVLRNTVGAAFTVAKQVILGVMNALDITCDSVLDFTAVLGDGLVAIRDWVKEHDVLGKALQTLADFITAAIVKVVEFVKAIWEIPAVHNAVTSFFTALNEGLKKAKDVFDKIIEPIKKFVKYMKTLADSDMLDWSAITSNFSLMMDEIAQNFGQKDWNSVGQNIARGISEGIKQYATQAVDSAVEMATSLFNKVCTFLGIHSPSTKFKWIGQNCVKGLIEGLKSMFAPLEEIANAITDTLVGALSDLDFNDLLITGSVITFLTFANRIIKVMESFAAPAKKFSEVLDGVKNVLNAFSKNIKSNNFKIKADAIRSLAISIGILAGSVFIISMIDPAALLRSVAVVTALIGVMTALALVISKVPDTKGIGKLSVVLLAFGACITLIASAVKKISKIDSSSLESSLKGILVLTGMMGLITIALSNASGKVDPKSIANISLVMLSFGASMRLMASAIKAIGKLESGKVKQATNTLMALTTFAVGIVALSGAFGDRLMWTDNIAKCLISFAASMLVLAKVIKYISKMSSADVEKGIDTIRSLEILIAAFIAFNAIVAKFTKENFTDPGNGMLKMAASLLILTRVIKQISSLSEYDIRKGLKVIRSLMTYYGAFMALCAFMGAATKYQVLDPGNMLLKMAAAIGILIVSIKMISSMTESEVDRGISVITKCLALFALVTSVSLFAGRNADKAGTMMIKMAGAIGILVLVVRLIRGLSDEDIDRGMKFIKGVMHLFTEVVAVSLFAGQNADKAGSMLMKMAIPIAVLAASIAALSFLDQDKIRQASETLSIAIVAFSTLSLSASKISKGAVGSLIVLGVLVAELAAILAIFSALNIQNALPNASALGILLMSLSASLLIISNVKSVSKNAIIGLTALSTVIVLLAAILGVMSALDISISIETASSISILLLSLSAVFGMLALLGPLAKTAVAGAASFDIAIAIIGGLIVGLGALVTYVPQVEEFLNKGIPVLSAIGTAIGEFIGNFIRGLAGFDTADATSLTDKLTNFISGMGNAINSVGDIDDSKIDTIKKVCTAFLAISGTGLVSNLLNFLGSGDGLDKMGKQLPKFGTALQKFSNSLTKDGGIDAEAMNSASKAMTALSKLNGSILASGGLLEKITGAKDLGAFGDQLVKFGAGLRNFSEEVSGDNAIDSAAIDNAVTAANSISQLQKGLYGSGGIVQKLAGEKDLSAFGTNLVTFGGSLKEFSTTVSAEGAINTNAIQNAVNAAQSLADLEKSLDSIGGLISLLTGKSDFSTFGINLTHLGKALVGFSSSVSGEDFDVESVSEVIDIIGKLAEIENVLPNEVGLFSSISGDYTMSLTHLGEQLSGFFESVKGIDTSNTADLSIGISSIIDIISSLSNVNSETISNFSKSIDLLSKTNLKGLNDAFNSLDTSQISSAGKSITSSLADGIKNNASSITSAVKSAVKAASNAINGQISSFNSAGKKLAKALATGITNGSSGAKTAAKTMAVNAARAANKSGKFKTAGKACAEGFAQGITSGSSTAITAAVDMAVSAYQAAKKKLDVNSPSKLFRRMALCVPEGFAQGIERGIKFVVTASEAMAQASIDTTSTALDSINSLNLSSIDANPTITPVVDLSNVNRGASQIASLLNLNPSIGLASNLGAISASMSGRNQNESNADVINALKDVKRAITKSAKPTYNINGISYDDGSNVAEAVSDLVRAVKVGGRM